MIDRRPSGEAPQRTTEELVDWLTSVSHRFEGVRDPDAITAAVAELTVPMLGDLAVVARIRRGEAPALTVTAVDAGVAGEARRRLEAAPGVLARLTAAAARGERLRWRWIPALDESALAALGRGEPALQPLLTALDVTSLILVPLRAHGRALGLLVLAGTGGGRRLRAPELAACQVLARRAGLALAASEAATSEPTVTRMQQAERRWGSLFQHARWGAALLDAAEFRFEAVNRALAAMHGIDDPAELIGRPATDLFPTESRAELARELRRGAEEPHDYEAYHRRGARGRIPVLVTLTPVAEPDGGPARTVMMQVQDLSQLRRTEERLERAQRLEAVGRLAGGVAHEVNNMMTVVLGFADLMLAARDFPDTHREEAEEIRRAAERVGTITRQLLAFSRRQQLHPEVLDLDEVIESAGQLLRPLLPADVELRIEPGGHGCRTLADRVQIEQVLVNLAFNARDAMPHGGRLHIRTGRYRHEAAMPSPVPDVAVPPGDYCTIEVADTGVGMDADTQARVFEPFFTTKQTGAGTGLGLSTVYGIVKQSGGFVWVTSTPGEGARFTVCLPVTAVEPRREEHAAASGARGGSETVLIVEDEPLVRGLATRVLAEEGYRVLAAGDGLEALQVLADHGAEVDLVLTDLVMPFLGGRRLRDRLQELFPGLPVIYMSAYASEEALSRGWLEPGEQLLQKPFTRDVLVRTIRATLDAAQRVARA